MRAIEALSGEIQSIEHGLKAQAALIASELSKFVAIDDARVIRSISEVQTLSRQLALALSKVGSAKLDAMREDTGGQSFAEGAALEQRVRSCQSFINQWQKIEALVRAQIPVKPMPLLHQPDAVGQSQLSQYDTAFQVLQGLMTPTTQTETAREHGCFADISLPNSTFIAYAHAAYRTLLAKQLNVPTRFLDVGCGSGFKMMIAEQFFDISEGLEYDPTYAAAAQELLMRTNRDKSSVQVADGMVFDGYDQYDVIYFYRPMRHDDQLQILERQIVEMARSGTLIIAPYKVFESRYKALGCARIVGWLYMTDTSQKEADVLQKQAEMTGAFVGKPAPNAASIWDPILASSARKGFGL